MACHVHVSVRHRLKSDDQRQTTMGGGGAWQTAFLGLGLRDAIGKVPSQTVLLSLFQPAAIRGIRTSMACLLLIDE